MGSAENPGLPKMEGQPGLERNASQRLGTQEGGCVSNDLVEKKSEMVPRGLWVLIFGSVQ